MTGAPVLQRASTRAVLDHAWDAARFRADDIMAARGLTRSTTLASLDALVEAGLVREVAEAVAGRVGRPSRFFELHPGGGLLVGLDAGAHRSTAVVTDLAGRVLATSHLVTTTEVETLPEPAQRRTDALRCVDQALASAGRERHQVVAVGIGVPAPVDAAGDSPPGTLDFWRHMNAGLGRAFEQAYPMVRIENDASLAACAEASRGQAIGSDNFVALLAGRRLGAGVFLDGRLIRGAHGGVGEMAGLDRVEGVGGAWGLGQLAEKWVRRRLADGAVPAGHPWHHLPDGVVPTERLLCSPATDDPLLAELVAELGGLLARVCQAIAHFYDPELVVVCGDVARSLGAVVSAARRQLADGLELPPPRLELSTLGHDVVALGAAAAARDEARGRLLDLVGRGDATRPAPDQAVD